MALTGHHHHINEHIDATINIMLSNCNIFERQQQYRNRFQHNNHHQYPPRRLWHSAAGSRRTRRSIYASRQACPPAGAPTTQEDPSSSTENLLHCACISEERMSLTRLESFSKSVARVESFKSVARLESCKERDSAGVF